MLSLSGGLPRPARSSVIQIIANVMNPHGTHKSHPMWIESGTYAAVPL